MNEIEVTPLTAQEKAELHKQEAIVELGFLRMRDCAEALRIIRDQRLYRTKAKTFAEYCEKNWGKNRDAVDKMLAVWEARKEIAENLCKEKPLQSLVKTAPDSAIRALEAVPKRSQKRVAKAAAKNGKLTAKAIHEAAAPKAKGKAKSEPPDRIFPRNIEAPERVVCPGVTQEAINQRISDAYGSNGNGQPAAVAEKPAVMAANSPLNAFQILSALAADTSDLTNLDKLVTVRAVLAAFDAEVIAHMDDWLEDPDGIRAGVECLRAVLEKL